jgi:cbb3-type cytochrome oxidase subunit 1
MMIFGVAYHVVPRFTGHALYSRRLAGAHWWMANVGLLFMACGFIATPYASRAAGLCVAIGGTLSACGAYAFIMNLWRTIDGPAAKPVAAKPVAAKASAPTSRADLPLADG